MQASCGQRCAINRSNMSNSAIDFCQTAATATPSNASRALCSAARLRDRRRARQEAVDAGGRPIIGGKIKRCGKAHPAAQRRQQPVLEMLGDIEESRGAGSAVEIFVAAPDRKLDSVPVELQRYGAGAVAEVPDDHCPRIARSPSVAVLAHISHIRPPGAISHTSGVTRESPSWIDARGEPVPNPATHGPPGQNVSSIALAGGRNGSQTGLAANVYNGWYAVVAPESRQWPLSAHRGCSAGHRRPSQCGR